MTQQLKKSLELVTPKILRAELARRHLSDFIAYTKPDYEFNWHHTAICNLVDRFVKGEIKKLLIFAPPQHGKSEITTRRAPAQMLGIDPRKRIAVISYSKELAMSFNRDIQRIIDDYSYKEIFPETILNRSNVVANSKQGYIRNNTMFETIPYKGSVRTVGLEGSLTGFPVDIAIFDDLYKSRDEALSAKHQSSVRSFWETVLIPRLHNDSQILGTFTRWSENDLGGWLLANDTGWTVLSLPAIKEIHDEHDPRRMGEPLWPSRHSLERLVKIKKDSPIVFNSLYQQKPQAPDEIKIYKYTIIDKMPTHLPFRYGVDFGFSNDPTAIGQHCWEKINGKVRFYVNEILYRTRMTNAMIIKHLKDRGVPLTAPYYADRDPKDIAELRLLGMNIIGAVKGNVVAGISKMQELELYVTRDSHNAIHNFDNYQWEVFNGKPINVPVENGADHICDEMRYCYLTATHGPQSGGSASAW